jgi:LemA protein
MFTWIILGLLIVLILWAISAYNRLTTLKLRVDESWSDIDVQLKRRYDLIPNLVETVKGYATHESGTLEKVIAARNSAMHATGAAERAAAENQLSQTLKSIFALSEAYPDLKANQGFLQLQQELTDTEDKVQASRRFYNGNVRDFNTALHVFPTVLIGRMLGFTAREFFEAAESEKAVPQVKF